MIFHTAQLAKLQNFNSTLINSSETAKIFGTPRGMKANASGNALFPMTLFSRQIRKVFSQSRTHLKILKKKSLCYRMDLLQAPTIIFLSMHKINCNRTSVLQMESLLFSSQLLPGHGEKLAGIYLWLPSVAEAPAQW